MAKHAILERGQAVYGGLTEDTEPDPDHDVNGHGGQVKPYAGRVRDYHGGRVVPQAGWSDVIAVCHVRVRVLDERQRAFGAGQRGRLVPATVEHDAEHRRQWSYVPVDQLDDRETIRILETLTQRFANVTSRLAKVVAYEYCMQGHVHGPNGHYTWVELVSVPCG